MFTPTSRQWLSVLRLTPIILGSILLFACTDLGLAIAYAKQLFNAPLDESKWDYTRDRRWSTAWFLLYSGFFPFLSVTHITVDAALFFFAQLNPICTLTLSILLSLGWIIQLSFWCHCDYGPDSNTCYQFYIMGDQHSDMKSSLSGVSGGITGAKVIFGMIVLVLYLAYLTLAATAVENMRRTGHVRIDDQEEQGPEDGYLIENRHLASHSVEHLRSLGSLLRGGTGV